MKINILHITDLHIGNKNNTSDFLRDGFYKDYIDKLALKINIQYDFLIITGDYINAIDSTPKVEKFEHASKIISYIQNKFGISNEKTFLCIGNHDIDIKEEENDKHHEARTGYLDFFPKHTGKPIANYNNLMFLYKEQNTFILTLDATYKSKGKITPGMLDVEDIDSCINLLRDNNVDENSTLFILTHYPFIEISGTMSTLEETGWDEKHLWKSAFVLRKRIESLRNKLKQNTFVFFGDIHFPYQNNYEGLIYFSSGRLGTDIFKPKESKPESLSMIPRQARIYLISENSIEIKTASWNPISVTENPHIGEWDIAEAELKFNERTVVIDESTSVQTVKMEVFCNSTEQKIIQSITSQKMYKFGRFNTAHDDNVSLAWILINKLLNNHSLLCDIVSNMQNWIISQSLVSKDSILFGVDCWGNVISSQLSAVTDISNYCTVSRAEGKYHSDDELLCDEIKSDLKKYINIIIITDVVATGNGSDFIFKSIKPYCSEHARFFVFSVIADETQNHYLRENYTHVTSCAKLRIPIIHKDKLPDEEILPSIITFN